MRRVHKLAGTEWRAGDSWTEDSLMPASSHHPEDSCLNSTPLDTTQINICNQCILSEYIIQNSVHKMMINKFSVICQYTSVVLDLTIKRFPHETTEPKTGSSSFLLSGAKLLTTY